MSRFSEGVDLEYRLKLNNFKKELQSIPGMTKREARKMTKSWVKAQRDMEKESRAKAKKSQKAWAQASSYIQGGLGKISPGLQSAVGGVSSLSGGMGGLAAAAGPAALAAAAIAAVGLAAVGATKQLTDLALSTRDYYREIDAAASQTGLTRDEITALKFAARGASASADDMYKAATRLAEQLDAGAMGSRRAVEAFSALGVSQEELENRTLSTGEALRLAVDRLSAMEDPTRRAQVQATLLGKTAGKDLIDALDGSGAVLDQWIGKVQDAGASVTDDGMQAADDWDQALADLSLTMQGLKNQVGGPFLKDVLVPMATVTAQVADATDILDASLSAVSSTVEALFPRISALADLYGYLTDQDPLSDRTGDELGAGGQITGSVSGPVTSFGPEGETPAALPALSPTPSTSSASSTKDAKDAKESASALRAAREEAARATRNLAVEEANLGESIRATQASMADQAQAEIDNIARVEEYRREQIEESQRAEARASQQRIEAAQEAASKARNSVIEIGQATEQIGSLIMDVYSQRIEAARDGSREERKLMKQQFVAQKAINLATAAQNLALSISSIWAQWAGNPVVAGVLTGVASAVGASQIALIAAEQPKFHMGGMIGGAPSAPDEVGITARTGEAVLTERGVDAIGGPAGVSAANSGGAHTQPVVAIAMYGHRVYDDMTRDSLRGGTSPLSRAVRHARQGRIGHR